METPYLDKKIEELEKQSVYTSFSDVDSERLEEYLEIKSKLKNL